VRSHYFATPSRAILFDYSFDGVFRSVEDSLERLGLDQIDVLYAHDLGADTHGSRAASDRRLREFLDGGYRALEQLRAQGVVHAIGAGCNEWEVCEALIKSADIDLILLAGRYTLLEQTALDTFLPLCAEKGVGVVVGGPYNSGILAGGAMYNYQPAPADIVARVRDLKAVCEAHGVGLAEAALRFPLGHPAVVSVVAGAISPAEVEGNIAAIGRSIPPVLWSDLKAERLIRGDAPVPM
jgi:D-threo-aldose 1-dehydrogenase